MSILEDTDSSRRLATFADWTFKDAGLHVPTVLSLRAFDEGKRYFFSRPPEGVPEDAVRKYFAVVRKSTSRWLRAEDPNFFALLQEAHQLHGYLWGTLGQTSNLPTDYEFVSGELAALTDLLDTPSLGIEKPLLSARPLPASESEKLLSVRQTPEPPKVPDGKHIQGWAGRLVGGRDEKLGEVILESREPPFYQMIRIQWGGAVPEELILGRGEFGEIRMIFRRRKDKDFLTVLSLENIAGGSGDLWYDPYVVEDGLQIRVPFELPSSGDTARESGRRAILEATLSALYRSGCQEPCGSQLLWRWQRIIEASELKAYFPELEGILAILAKSPPPAFEKESEKAWLGSVTLVKNNAEGTAPKKQ